MVVYMQGFDHLCCSVLKWSFTNTDSDETNVRLELTSCGIPHTQPSGHRVEYAMATAIRIRSNLGVQSRNNQASRADYTAEDNDTVRQGADQMRPKACSLSV
ncbi:hypothetical protein R1flu_012282 [Riccia fluitans]|uniref:Uncharacterized protein n=1 Tax=Riccia fluitans TaxID=41844 RepID=A0ABD1ZAD8_9MARC